MKKIKEGAKAPDFSLPCSDGSELRLSDFKGKKNVVLYFYPKDDTPGCTREACDFRDTRKSFTSKHTEIFGVSADSLESHRKFQDKYKLPFLLLSDEDKKVLKLYGVWKKKSLYGRSFMGIERTTFVIDKKGTLRKIFPKVKVEGHIQEVLDLVKAL